MDLINELRNKIYGPKWCGNCEAVREVRVYERAGSREVSFSPDGTRVNVNFEGARVCLTCFKNVDESMPQIENNRPRK